MSELHTTLRLLRAHQACQPRYRVARKALGPTWGDDTPIPLSRILASNGIRDVIWCFCALIDGPGWMREYILDCAEHVQSIWQKSYPNDDHPQEMIDIARAFLRGEASEEEVRVAARDTCASTYIYNFDTRTFTFDASVAGYAAIAIFYAGVYVVGDDTAADLVAYYAATAAATADAGPNTEREWQAVRFLEYCTRNQEI